MSHPVDPHVGLEARLVVQRPGFTLDIDLRAGPGEVVALLGPNGAGKTTALRALAGLQPLDDGTVRLAGVELAGPPQDRPVGVVFQDYLLFPHLSALENVAFGPRCQGLGKVRAREVAYNWLARVGLAEFARAMPRHLSGGQAQRVALARALAPQPRLLLLDEPLSALDAGTRPAVRAELGRHLADHRGVTILVTHDPLEAMVLADRIVVIEAGQVVQDGSPAEITAHPRSDYVARLVGLNLYRGDADGHTVTLRNGATLVTADAATGPVFVAFRPSAVSLFASRPDGSPRNTWEATVSGVERYGDNVRVHLTGPLDAAADITPAAAAQLRLAPGERIWAAVKATETLGYPA